MFLHHAIQSVISMSLFCHFPSSLPIIIKLQNCVSSQLATKTWTHHTTCHKNLHLSHWCSLMRLACISVHYFISLQYKLTALRNILITFEKCGQALWWSDWKVKSHFPSIVHSLNSRSAGASFMAMKLKHCITTVYVHK